MTCGGKMPPASNVARTFRERVGHFDEAPRHRARRRSLLRQRRRSARAASSMSLDRPPRHHRLRDAGQQQVRMRRPVGQAELDGLRAHRLPLLVGRDDRQADQRAAVVVAPRHGARRLLGLEQADERVGGAVAERHQRAGVLRQAGDQPPRDAVEPARRACCASGARRR